MNANFWPYLELAHCLAKKERKGFGNMFRHQVETFTILFEFGYKDPVLLKAALTHDLVEDGQEVGFTDFNKIITADSDGAAVFELVKEVSIIEVNGEREPKSAFLKRVLLEGSQQAKLIKLADRLSNLNSLLISHDSVFIHRYINETRDYIMPYAFQIDKSIAHELDRNILTLNSYNFG